MYVCVTLENAIISCLVQVYTVCSSVTLRNVCMTAASEVGDFLFKH